MSILHLKKSRVASELKYHLHPIPFTVKTMALPSLFAGKMHALLCRTRRTNIKGRDWYDLIWFVKNNVPCDLYYLKNKMAQTGHIDVSEELSLWSDAFFSDYLVQEIRVLTSN